MDIFVGTIVCLSIVIALQMLVTRICGENPTLRTHETLLRLVVLTWCVVAGLKVEYINRIVGPGDEIVHEQTAREVAAYLSAGKFADAWWYFGAGNDGYRFLVGCYYAFTGAPEITIYFINGGLACWGLLSLLETLGRGTRTGRIGWWLVLLICCAPSALFWGTTHLKEGPMLWAICMLLRGVLRFDRQESQGGLALPFCGFLLGSFLRPHIMIAWVAAVFVALAISRRKFSMAVCGLLGMAASAYILQWVAPHLTQGFINDGITQTMQAGLYQRGAEATTGSTIRYATGAPIPVFSGAMLILFRPYPFEVFNLQSLFAGLEAWAIVAMTAYGWLAIGRRESACRLPMVIASVVAFVALALFFSYMYNMGLMVRQRLQVLPALLCLVAVPYLVASTAKRRGEILRFQANEPCRRPSFAPTSQLNRKRPFRQNSRSTEMPKHTENGPIHKFPPGSAVRQLPHA